MAKRKVKQSNRNREAAKYKNSITKIRDWIGFFLTVAGFFLSLSGTVHVDVQIQHNIDIEFCNNFNKTDRIQWNREIYPVNLDDTADNKKKDVANTQKHPVEWVYINSLEYLQETPRRKKLMDK